MWCLILLPERGSKINYFLQVGIESMTDANETIEGGKQSILTLGSLCLPFYSGIQGEIKNMHFTSNKKTEDTG